MEHRVDNFIVQVEVQIAPHIHQLIFIQLDGTSLGVVPAKYIWRKCRPLNLNVDSTQSRIAKFPCSNTKR